MVLEELESEIIQNAKTEAQRIIAESQEEAKTLEEEAKARVKSKKNSLEEDLERQIAFLATIQKTRARMNMKHLLVSEKKALIDHVYAGFSELLEKNKATMIKKLYEKAKKDIKPAKIYVNQSDQRMAKTIFKGLEIEPKQITGGFIAESKDGRELVDYSYDTLLETVRGLSLQKVHKELFGG